MNKQGLRNSKSNWLSYQTQADWKYVKHVYENSYMLFGGDIKNMYPEDDGWIYPKNKYPNPYKDTGSGEMITHIMVCPKCESGDDISHCGTIAYDCDEEGITNAITIGACYGHYDELENGN